MPRWRLYARDAEGWVDLHIIIEGERFEAEMACGRESAWLGLPVSAEQVEQADAKSASQKSAILHKSINGVDEA